MSSKKPEGLFEFLILNLLNQEMNYGYGLIKKIKEITGQHWDPSYGTIYGTLSRLEENELIERVEKNHEDRKYFEITKKGEKKLKNFEENQEELRNKSEEIILGLMNIYKEFNDEEKLLELIKKIDKDFSEIDLSINNIE